jgi:hypothetical protein
MVGKETQATQQKFPRQRTRSHSAFARFTMSISGSASFQRMRIPVDE